MDVAAIDLERMKRGDRMFDVGRVARNDYIGEDYGRRLVTQAKRLLLAA
jgi:hypothetical protein